MQKQPTSWLVVLPVSAALAVFLPVVQRPFIYDEFIHLYNLVNFGTRELLITPHAGHLLYFSNLIYWPLYKLFGLRASAYYAIALVTHLLNVALCYHVIARFTGRPAVAAIAATLWGCAAVNLGTIGWFAVYGQLLVATILLWLLRDIARLAADGAVPSIRIAVWWAVLLVAACGSFGYGLCIAALFFPVATFMLDAGASWRRVFARFAGSSIAVAILYVVLHRLQAAVSGRAALYGVGGLVGGLQSLSWGSAALTIAAIFWAAGYGVANLFTGSLFYAGSGRVVAGPFQGLSEEGAGVASCIVLAVWLAVSALSLRNRSHAAVRQAIGLGTLAVACYALVSLRIGPNDPAPAAVDAFRAIGGDPWQLTWMPRIMIPRYQYVPSLLLAIAATLVLPPSIGRDRTLRTALFGTAAALWVAICVGLDARAVRTDRAPWDPQSLVVGWLRRAVSAFPSGSTVYVDNGPAPIPFNTPDDILPGRAAITLLLFPDSVVDGRRVYFVEHDQQLLEQLRSEAETPIAHLVVGAKDVPPDANYVRDRRPRAK